ncbi:MAG: DUF1799 domain-containing protein [Rudaea sp.]|nr:DUF1799 domain-containing protein [Rudaea sp.]
MAWSRWVAGAGPVVEGERLWDIEARYSNCNSAYCREVCGKTRCAECPAPLLLPESQVGIAAYIKCGTQWRTGFSGRTGLDYPACIQTLKIYRRELRKELPDDPLVTTPLADLMNDMQVIESAMLQADHEKREAERKNEGTV